MTAAPAFAANAPLTVSPTEYDGRRRLLDDSITFCIDSWSESKELDRGIGEAIAQALLLEPEFYPFDSALPESLTPDWFFILLNDHCDAYLGMPMGSFSSYPDFLQFSTPYMETGYILISTSPTYGDLQAVMDSDGPKVVGVLSRSMMNFSLSMYLRTQSSRVQRHIYRSDEALLSAVRSGEADAGLIWEPSFHSLVRDDDEFTIGAPNPLDDARWPVGIGVIAENTYLRTMLDDAITALKRDGDIDEIVEEYRDRP